MRKIKVADFLIECLNRIGVQHVFLLPGGGAMHLNDALAKSENVIGVPLHHEQSAGIAAEAYGRVAQCGFGVAMVTSGPGASNVITPVVGAWIESIPMLVLSGQVKRSDLIGDRPLRQTGVQEIQTSEIVKPITKFVVTIQNAADTPRILKLALSHMLTGRHGPVWLDVPLDIQASTIIVNDADFECLIPAKEHPDSLVENNVSKIIAKLKTSTRPLFLLGHGVRLSGSAELFKKVCEEARIPCLFTWNAADLLEWDNELNVGRPGVVAARAPNFAVQNCDLLISIGCRIDNVVTGYNPDGFAPNAFKVIVDIDEAELSRHPFPESLKINTDAKLFFEVFLRNLKGFSGPPDWIARCQNWKLKYPPLDGRSFETSKLSHFQFVDAVSDLIEPSTLVVTGSSGLAIEIFYMAFRNKKGQRFFLTSGLGSMGYALPAAIGACIANNSTKTYCFEGDGSLMLNLQELVSLKSLNLPICLFVMNNSGYASIRNTQKNYFEGRMLASDFDSGLDIPDFLELASAIGICCEKVETLKDLKKAFLKTKQLVAPIIIDVQLEVNETLTPKVSATPQRDGSMVSMPLEDMSPLLPLEVLRDEMIVDVNQRSIDVRQAK